MSDGHREECRAGKRREDPGGLGGIQQGRRGGGLDLPHGGLREPRGAEGAGRAAGLAADHGRDLKSFPDFTYVLEQQVAFDDKVIAYLTATATHTGKAWAPPPDARDQSIPSLLAGGAPTWQQWTAKHFHLFRMVDGKIAEHSSSRDDLGMLQQLGLVRLGASQ